MDKKKYGFSNERAENHVEYFIKKERLAVQLIYKK